MRKFVLFLVNVAIAWVIGYFIVAYLEDANRFKPELQALIEERTGVWVDLRGDLDWDLFPPLELNAQDVHAEYEGRTWSLGRLKLHVDFKSLITERDGPEDWSIHDLTLTDLTMLDSSGRLDVAELQINDLGLDRPASIASNLTYTPTDGEPVPMVLTGEVTYQSATEAIEVDNLAFESAFGSGECNIDVAPGQKTWPDWSATDDSLLPLDTLRDFNWNGICDLANVTYEDQTFEDVRVVLDNSDAKLHLLGHVPSFFGGTADIELDIGADQEPVVWMLTPDLENVDSQQLVDWLDQSLEWAAPLAYGGAFEMTGNTTVELASSVTGQTHFDGGQGQLNITKIKQQLLRIAMLLGKPDAIQRWPNVLDYQRFVGDWRIDQQHHTLDLALDNLTVIAEGDYNVKQDELDMLVELTFNDDPVYSSLDVNPLLVGLPIPVRCRGSLEDPTCKVDDDMAKRLVASALQAKEGTELRTKLDEAIDEKVPEEYRDAARSLLDLLGRSLNDAEKD